MAVTEHLLKKPKHYQEHAHVCEAQRLAAGGGGGLRGGCAPFSSKRSARSGAWPRNVLLHPTPNGLLCGVLRERYARACGGLASWMRTRDGDVCRAGEL